jgi:hypothetical protein
MSDYISLHQLPRELREIAGVTAPVYQSLYRKIVDGHLTATRTPAGRWMISRKDLPQTHTGWALDDFAQGLAADHADTWTYCTWGR